MKTIGRLDKIRQIAEYYGLKEQLSQTEEECAELIQAASKMNRAKTSTERYLATDKVTEEMADVLIMIWQLKRLLGNHTALSEMIDQKLDRQIERIHEELNGDTER